MERFDVTLSFRRSDADRARALLVALEAEGLRVYADDGESVTLLGIQRGVQEYLARSRFAAVWVHADGADPRAAHWFLAAAMVAAREELSKRVVLLGSQPVPDLPPALAKLPFFVVPEKADPAFAPFVATLVERCQGVRGSLGSLAPLQRPTWYPNPAAGPDRFVGRHGLLYALHDGLARERAVTLVGPALGYDQPGQRGIGRTLLAQEYALRFGPAWPGGIVWLRAHGDADLPPDIRERLQRDQLRAVARRMGVVVPGMSAAEIDAALARTIGARNEPVLWVVDDLPEGLSPGERDAWVVRDPLVRTVFIARSAQAGVTLEVPPLPRREGYTLVTRSWRPHTPDEEASGWRIVDDLGGQPLALDAVGGVFGVGGGPRAHATLRALLRKDTDDVRNAAEALFPFLPEAGSMPVAAALGRCLEQLSPEAHELVRLATVLGGAPLDPVLAAHVLRVAEGHDVDTAQLKTEHGLSQLEQAGVATRLSVEGALDAERSIHGIWLALHRLRDPEPWRTPKLREALVRVLAERLASGEEPGTTILGVARVLSRQPADLAEATLLHAVGRALLAGGDAEEAERCFRMAHAARDRFSGGDPREALASLEGIAAAAWARDERQDAVRTLEDVLSTRRDRLGDGDPSTLATMDQLAKWYLELGRRSEARALVERVLEGRRRTVGTMHPQTLDAQARMAQIYAADGDLVQATRMVDDVLGRLGRLPDNKVLGALEGVVAVATALRSAGELNPARRMLEQANVHLRRLVGAEDLRFIHAQTVYAKVLVDLDDLGVARRVETDTLAALIRVHGEAHPDTLTMMNNLGTTLSGLGEMAGARQHLEKCFKLRATLLGMRHTDTVVTGWNLHLVLHRMGQDSGAVLADLEWLLEARPDALSAKQRKVREGLQELVREPVRREEQGPGWQNVLLRVMNPFRRK